MSANQLRRREEERASRVRRSVKNRYVQPVQVVLLTNPPGEHHDSKGDRGRSDVSSGRFEEERVRHLLERIASCSSPGFSSGAFGEMREIRNLARQHGHSVAKEIVDFLGQRKSEATNCYDFGDALELAGAAGLDEVIRGFLAAKQDHRLRHFYAGVAGDIPHERSIKMLLSALWGDESYDVQCQAASSLGQIAEEARKAKRSVVIRWWLHRAKRSLERRVLAEYHKVDPGGAWTPPLISACSEALHKVYDSRVKSERVLHKIFIRYVSRR